MKKTLCAITLASCIATTSCVGPNNAFTGLTAWNTRVTDSKWANEAIYLVMWIIPVYPVVLTFDGLVFNAFEFWGGENPIGEPGEMESQGKK